MVLGLLPLMETVGLAVEKERLTRSYLEFRKNECSWCDFVKMTVFCHLISIPDFSIYFWPVLVLTHRLTPIF